MTANLQCYTAARTIAVLIHLAAGPRSAPELAELLDVAKPTVRRILGLLAHAGYVDRLPDDAYRKRYRLTLRARLLGQHMATAASLPPGAAVLLGAERRARAQHAAKQAHHWLEV